MSNPPPPPHQVPYQTPQAYYQPVNPRPTSVTVLAILAIIFGGLGSACGWTNVLPYFNPSMQNEVTRAFSSEPVMRVWAVFSALWGWGVSVLLLIAGILCLRLRPLGRTLMLVYAWSTLVMAVPGLIMNFVYMMPALENLKKQNPGNPGIAAGVTAGYIGAIAGLVIGLGIVAWVLYVMSRPHVKAAFAADGATPVSSPSPGQP